MRHNKFQTYRVIQNLWAFRVSHEIAQNSILHDHFCFFVSKGIKNLTNKTFLKEEKICGKNQIENSSMFSPIFDERVIVKSIKIKLLSTFFNSLRFEKLSSRYYIWIMKFYNFCFYIFYFLNSFDKKLICHP